MEIKIEEGASRSEPTKIKDVKKLLAGNAHYNDNIKKYVNEEGIDERKISNQTPSYIVILELTEDDIQDHFIEQDSMNITKNNNVWYELDNYSLISASGENMKLITSEGNELENIVQSEAEGRNGLKTSWKNNKGKEGVVEGYPVLLKEM